MTILLVGLVLFLLLVSAFRANPVAAILGLTLPLLVVCWLIRLGAQ